MARGCLISFVLVAPLWVAAAALAGWAGLAAMVAAGVVGELIVFRSAWVEAWRDWRTERRIRKRLEQLRRQYELDTAVRRGCDRG